MFDGPIDRPIAPSARVSHEVGAPDHRPAPSQGRSRILKFQT